MSDIPEAKALRWLAFQFPKYEEPKDDTERLCNCIHGYALAGARKIEELASRLTSEGGAT